MDSRVIKTWRDPYDEGFSTTMARKIEIQKGVTVLVGCNGAGKTTLIRNIEDVLKEEGIPFFEYNNVTDGGSNAVSEALFNEDYSLMATNAFSSEGEQISSNMTQVALKLGDFIITGKKKGNKYDELFASIFEDKVKEITTDERWVFFDAIDSGSSIDNILEYKDLFNTMMKHAESIGRDLYIVVAANSYEMVINNPCFDVMTGKYVKPFKTYNSYKKFVLKTKEKKEKRYEKINIENEEKENIQT